MPKTTLQRITINNILAFLVVGSYTSIWSFIIYYGVTTSIATGTDPKILILALVEGLKEILTTMTIIVVLVIQYHFRTAPKETS